MRIDDFLAEVGLAPSSMEKYEDWLIQLCEWLQDQGYNFGELDPKMYRAFLATRPWNSRTCKKSLSAVKKYARWAHGEVHPIMGMKVRATEAEPGRSLEHDEVVQLLEFIPAQNDSKAVRDMAMTRLMLDCGPRATSFCNINLDHLDIPHRKLHFKQKGGSYRYSVLSEETIYWLYIWISEVRSKYADCGNLFVSLRGGNPHTRYGLGTIWRKLGIAAGLGPIAPHDMRRTGCAEWLRNGVPMDLIAKQFGWKSTRMVEHYGRGVAVEACRAFLPMYGTIPINVEREVLEHLSLQTQAAIKTTLERATRFELVNVSDAPESNSKVNDGAPLGASSEETQSTT